MLSKKEQLVEVNEKLVQFKETPLWSIIRDKTITDIRDIDSQWHLYNVDSKELKELIIRKRALSYLLNIETLLGAEKEGLESELFKSNNHDINVALDYDNETKLENKKVDGGGQYGV